MEWPRRMRSVGHGYLIHGIMGSGYEPFETAFHGICATLLSTALGTLAAIGLSRSDYVNPYLANDCATIITVADVLFLFRVHG